MPKYLPIKAAKVVAEEHELEQVILVAWDGKRAHVVTYGTTIEACDQAAQGGNVVKAALGFPDTMCHVDTSRVKRLKERIKELQRDLEHFIFNDKTLKGRLLREVIDMCNDAQANYRKYIRLEFEQTDFNGFCAAIVHSLEKCCKEIRREENEW